MGSVSSIYFGIRREYAVWWFVFFESAAARAGVVLYALYNTLHFKANAPVKNGIY
jgi:hypothetical protein